MGSSLAMKTPLVPKYDAAPRCVPAVLSVICLARGVKRGVASLDAHVSICRLLTAPRALDTLSPCFRTDSADHAQISGSTSVRTSL